MFTLPGQVELLDDAWLGRARTFLEPKRSDEQLLHRNAPRLGEMLGLHDWFDTMSGIGRDHEKLGHMLQLHGFTKKQLAKLLDG